MQCLPMTWFHQWWSRSLNGNFWSDTEGVRETRQEYFKASLFSHVAPILQLSSGHCYGLSCFFQMLICKLQSSSVQEVGSGFGSCVPSLAKLRDTRPKKDVSQLNRRSSAQRSLNQGVLSVCCSCHQLCGGPCMLQ